MRVEGIVFAGIESPRAVELAAFFADVLGLPLEEEGDVRTLRLPGGDVLALIPPRFLGPPSDTVLGFLVDDLDVALAALDERGVERHGPLLQSDEYRWQHFLAPDGRSFSLLERRR